MIKLIIHENGPKLKGYCLHMERAHQMFRTVSGKKTHNKASYHKV